MNVSKISQRRTTFRSERVQYDSGIWFYFTREGTREGPFETREEAVTSLEAYIRCAQSKLFDANALQRINNLSLVA